MSKKISINMLSSADKIDGQGVGSAYLELLKLLHEDAADKFDIYINKGTKYDILHAHTVDLSFFFKMKLTKGKTVAYVHFLPTTLDGSIKLPKILFAIFKKYVIDFYKSADKMVVVNPIFIKDMVAAGLDKDKIVYIPNFVSKEKFHKYDDKKTEQVRRKYGLKKGDFAVLGAGQVQTRKGVLDFVKTAKMLPDVQFIWAGGFSFGAITDGYEELKKIVKKPPKNVRFLGIVPREEMADLYNAVNCLFVPSYNELFPVTILEAMSCDTPLLLRDLELYEDILFKKYLKGGSVEEFARQITLLKDDPEVYKTAVKNSVSTSKFYSKEHVLSMWEEFYTSLAGGEGEGKNAL